MSIGFVNDADFHDDWGDGQRAVYDIEGHIAEVLVGVREVLRLQFHRIGSGIGAFDFSITAEGKVGLGVELIIDCHIIACDGVLLAVINDLIAVAMLSDGDGDILGYRIDGQCAVYSGHQIVADCYFFTGVHRHIINFGYHIGLGAYVGDGALLRHFDVEDMRIA